MSEGTLVSWFSEDWVGLARLEHCLDARVRLPCSGGAEDQVRAALRQPPASAVQHLSHGAQLLLVKLFVHRLELGWYARGYVNPV